ncbi:ABC transporter permease [Ramlibacter tataouinensis]|uniref:Candidate ABC type nitrate/sulfonate/bicarbonate transport system, permease component n=1 Tax=Ramlibacter tataouinensis (strain ATCC BAA-407 / DSM 14655 / LMG 21543 / TTB310) TaxID=365046 RepID=F5Y4H6_RAMTT|nr:ABC transporter permease [Ramlibacter tataouinensis]AEG93823.1 candidate ABC type nitrate/sulfonate/bicarbonate transport system, permease component [Ramlibacter tataouinensis TTB310]
MSTADRSRIYTGAATVAVVLGAWVLGSRAGWISTQAFPSPEQFAAAARQLVWSEGFGDGRLHQHVLQSVKLILMGFFAATAVGVPLGLWMGWSRRAEAMANPIFLLIRPIPALAWIPLAIVWLGLGDAAKVMILWFAAFVPAVINSFTGVRNIERPIIEASRMLGVRGFALVKDVIVPGALPSIFTGLRLALQGCMTALVAAELLGAMLGIGKVLYQAGLDIYPAMILAGMVSVAVVGFALTAVLDVVEHRSMPWRTPH